MNSTMMQVLKLAMILVSTMIALRIGDELGEAGEEKGSRERPGRRSWEEAKTSDVLTTFTLYIRQAYNNRCLQSFLWFPTQFFLVYFLVKWYQEENQEQEI